MAVDTLKTGMPPELDLDGGYTIRVDAIDPSTGATVAGIVASKVTITALNLSPPGTDLAFGPFLLVPGPGTTVPTTGEPGPPLPGGTYPGFMGGTVYWYGYVDIAQGNNLGPRAGELDGHGGVVVSADPAAGTYMVLMPDNSSDSFPLPTS